jgi:hypothetical protein
MKHLIPVFLLAVLACCSCKKKDEPQSVVSYKVRVTNSTSISFTSIYSADNSTQTTGPIMTSSWSSANFEKKQGEHISFTVDGGSGNGDYSFSIFVNGSMVKNGTFSMPSAPKTIETDIF